MAKTKHQRFETAEIPRGDIQLAAYNPRKIDKQNRAALEKGLKTHGLVEPLVWNRRTGNLVSGHQRIATLDKLERGMDYELTVSVVDVDEREEALLNVQLNNPSMQGQFDFDMLGDMAQGFDLKFDEMGFSNFDVSMMFGGDDRFAGLFADTDSVKATKDEIKAIRDNRENMNEKYDKEQNADTFIVVVCADAEEKRALMRRMSVPVYEQYVTSKQLERLAGG